MIDRYPREPARWRKLAAVVLAVLLPVGLWDRRGPVVGIIAFVVYGGVLLVGTFNHRAAVSWSRRHVVLDAVVVVPLTFLALAYLTDLPLGACAGIGLVAGALLVPVALRRRGARTGP